MRDWQRALIAIGLVVGTFGAHAMTHELGMLIAVAATLAWLAVSRADLADLVRTLSGIARPRLDAIRRGRGTGQ